MGRDELGPRAVGLGPALRKRTKGRAMRNNKRERVWLVFIPGTLIVLVLIGIVSASNVTIPNNFTAGTTAVAAQVSVRPRKVQRRRFNALAAFIDLPGAGPRRGPGA